MIARLAVCAAAAASLAGCALLNAADPQDLYTVTPKSTFDPDLPSVYWQLAVEAPAAAANLNTGRIAIAMTPTSSDYYAKAAWTDRAPLMVQTRIVDSFENTNLALATRNNPKLRSPWNFNENVALGRSFRFGERRSLDVRGEAFNVLNRVRWGGATNNITSATFGRLTTQGNTPRRMQIGMRLFF